jgi:hypothetical protein
MSEFDKKISALTSGTDSTATDEYVIARGGSNFKISGALVAAGATKVGTLASLAVTGDLTVDTSTLKVDAANNRVGIGTASPAVPLEVLGASNSLISTFRTNDGTAANNAGGGFLGVASATASSRAATLWLDADGANFAGSDYAFIRKNGNSGSVDFVNYSSSAFNWRIDSGETLRMTLDASGNVGIGVTPGQLLTLGKTSGNFYTSFVGDASAVMGLLLGTSGNTVDGQLIYSNASQVMSFVTATAERARITAGGYFKASNDGTYNGATSTTHEFRAASPDGIALFIENTSSTTPYGFVCRFQNASPNDTTRYFATFNDNTESKAIIYSNGAFQSRVNSYGGISDSKLKQDIADAASQWDDIKGVRVRKFRFKSDPEGPFQIGVVAQELEVVSPGLVFESPDTEEREVEVEVEKTRPVLDEDGEPMLDEDGAPLTETYTETETRTERVALGTVTKSVKYSVLYMKAVGALQEAMARIESLEARLDALEN